MKRSLLVAVFSVWMVCGAQTDWRFADSTAQWNVLIYRQTFPGYIYRTDVFTPGSDVSVNSTNYQMINGSDLLLRKDSLNRIYALQDGDSVEYLLYNFNLAKDSSMILQYPWFNSGQRFSVWVSQIDSVLIGHYRKRLHVRYSGCFPHDTWVEGIGALNSHFLGPGITCPDFHENMLLCYFENNQQLYHENTFNTCVYNLTTDVSLTDRNNLQFISPNPATNSITLQLQQTPARATAFQLFDITGRMVLQKPLTETINRIELNGVSKGMYLYNVVTEGEKAGAGKLIIE